jgi:hypothetical protein
MDENNNPTATPETPDTEKATGESASAAWEEVGRQFKNLGESLASAFRAAWENEDTRRQVQLLESSLKSAAQEIEKGVQNAADSPEGQKVRAEAQRAATSAQTAGKKAAEDLRPQLMMALRQVNSELQKLLERMESETAKSDSDDPVNTKQG